MLKNRSNIWKTSENELNLNTHQQQNNKHLQKCTERVHKASKSEQKRKNIVRTKQTSEKKSIKTCENKQPGINKTNQHTSAKHVYQTKPNGSEQYAKYHQRLSQTSATKTTETSTKCENKQHK